MNETKSVRLRRIWAHTDNATLVDTLRQAEARFDERKDRESLRVRAYAMEEAGKRFPNAFAATDEELEARFERAYINGEEEPDINYMSVLMSHLMK